MYHRTLPCTLRCVALACLSVTAQAQDAPATASTADSGPATSGTLDTVNVVATNPVGGTGIPLRKYAGNVQTLSRDKLTTATVDLTERLSSALGSVSVNDTQGNPFQMDVNYRGFTASPVLGTPQGLSVYLDGMRMNEPFGDVVSWDLLPQIVIDKVTVVPGSNPMYGLNTLGGAISMTSKNGNTFSGTQASFGVGDFGRRSVDVEHGSHTDDDNIYFAASVYNDNGWGAYNASQVRQLFGKYTAYGNTWEASLSLSFADNMLNGNQTVPLSMLANAADGYSHFDYTGTQNASVNAQGTLALDTSNSLNGNIYLRSLTRSILNSNINSLVSASDNAPDCAATAACPATNLLAQYTQNIAGANLQWNNTDPLWEHNQLLSLGINAEWSNTSFSNVGQDAYLDGNNAVIGVDDYLSQASVSSANQRLGLYATSTIDLDEQLSLTVSARYDYAALTLSGLSCIDANDLCNGSSSVANGQLADVGGDHSYQRLNPSLGLTYLFNPQLTGFADYAEGFRTPSALELACADPAAPCSGVPNAFGADPNLAAVVSHTWEIGLRGNLSDRLVWRTAYYLTTLDNDILFNQSSLNTGYFSNVGQTRRQGVELGLDGHAKRLDYALDLDWIEATYQSAFAIANQNNSAFGIPVTPGNIIPGIPQWVFKGRVSYALDNATRVGMAVQAQGPTYARGDDNNLDVNGMVPGYATVKIDINRSLGKSVNVYAGASNLFNASYSSFGMLGANNLTTGAPEQFRAVGAPRTLYAGVQVRF